MDRRGRIKWIYSSRDNSDLAARCDQWAATYDSDLDEAIGWIGPQRAAAVFSELVPRQARVLDAVTGTGLVGQTLAAGGYENIAAADLSAGMLEEARKKKSIHARWRTRCDPSGVGLPGVLRQRSTSSWPTTP